jgi:hypothetical protein
MLARYFPNHTGQTIYSRVMKIMAEHVETQSDASKTFPKKKLFLKKTFSKKQLFLIKTPNNLKTLP